MSWTKEQLVLEAFAELALGANVFDLEPEEKETGLRRLDMMMAAWNAKGIHLGYVFPSSSVPSELDQESNLSDAAVEAVVTNLAIALAPGFGKQLSQDTRNRAKAGYDLLLTVAAMPAEQQLSGSVPRGAGNKPWQSSSPFMPEPAESVVDISGPLLP